MAGVDGVAFFADNPDRAGAEMMDEVRGVVRCPVGGACATQVIGSDSGNSCNEGYKVAVGETVILLHPLSL